MPPPPYVRLFASTSMNSYGANCAVFLNARLSNVRTYLSEPNASYVAPRGESRYTPVDGLEIPDSDAGGEMAHTLNLRRFSLKGDVENRTSVSRLASASNFFVSATV